MAKKIVNSKLTPAQALDVAVNMKRQGIPYAKIADHLRAQGYLSDRTGRPIKEMAVRYMVTQHEKEDRDAAAEDKAMEQAASDPKILVTGDTSFKDSVKAIMQSPNFTAEFKAQIVTAMASGETKITLDVADINKMIKAAVSASATK